MKIIGLTGPTGAGKGFTYQFFEKFGICCIDTDDVYHKLLIPPSKCVDELVNSFGETILNEDGTVNRKALASIVFADESRKKVELLESITHKYIIDRTHEMIAKCKKENKKAVVIDAPVLFESDIAKECDFTVAVICAAKTRMARIIDRDSITEEQAKMRINAQHNDSFFTSRATYTLVNDSAEKTVEEQIVAILTKENII